MIRRFDTAAAFRMATGAFLGAREAEHNLLFGITSNLIADEARGIRVEPRPYLAVVERGDRKEQVERIVAAACMTPPFHLVVSCLAPGADPDVREVMGELAADLAAIRTPPPGVLAPVEIAAAFAAAWCEPRGLVAERTVAERIYRLERVTPPTGVPGHVRVATPDDRDLLIEYTAAFHLEALGRPDAERARSVVELGLDHGQRTFYLWEMDGRVVSLAAAGGPTPNGIRIGPVYTPPGERGHGFASAVTAAATQAQLDAGRRFVFLFTDLANPTSNRIYQAIGYEPVIDMDQLTFELP